MSPSLVSFKQSTLKAQKKGGRQQIEIVSPKRPQCKNLKTFVTQRSLFQPTNYTSLKKENKRINVIQEQESAPKEYFKKPMGISPHNQSIETGSQISSPNVEPSSQTNILATNMMQITTSQAKTKTFTKSPPPKVRGYPSRYHDPLFITSLRVRSPRYMSPVTAEEYPFASRESL